MATGYTHGLTAETPLRKFALDCARAFGALVEMRDEASDAPIKLPEASNYHPKALLEAEKELSRLKHLNNGQREAAAAKEHSAALEARRAQETTMQASRIVYQRLISEVQAWQPPTAEHQGLKAFMLEQLQSSDEWDNGSLDKPSPLPTAQTGSEWITEQLASTRRSIGYHAAEWEKEQKRVAELRQWIIDLQNSLPPSPLL